MNTWERKSISSIVDSVIDYRGKTPPRSAEGIPVISAMHVKQGRLEHCGERFVSQETYDEWTTRGFIKPGDVLLTTEAPIGEVALVPSDQTYLVSQRIIAMQIDPTQACERFVMYSLLAGPHRKALENLGHGTTVASVFKEDVLNFQLPIPPIETQRVIGRVLGAFDDLIENNRRRIEILEEMARLLYREWFVHFRFPGHEDVDLVDSDLGPIPEGWEVQSFAELADFVNGFAFKPKHWLDEGLPIVKIKELKNGVTADTPRYHGADVGEKYHVNDGSVLFSWSADLNAYVWASGPALLNQHLFDVRPYEVSPLFIFLSLNERMEEFRARAQGTTMKHIKRSALGEVQIALPREELRDEFEGAARLMLDLQLNLSKQNRALREARDLLLPRLISGELDVSEIDFGLEAVGA